MYRFNRMCHCAVFNLKLLAWIPFSVVDHTERQFGVTTRSKREKKRRPRLKMKSIHIKSRAGGAPNTFHSKTERNRFEAVSISIYTWCCLPRETTLIAFSSCYLFFFSRFLETPSCSSTFPRADDRSFRVKRHRLSRPEHWSVSSPRKTERTEVPLITIYENEFIRERFYRARRIRYNCVYISSSYNKIDLFSTRWMMYG